MPAFTRSEVFQKYIENLSTLLNSPDSINEAVEWRNIINVEAEGKRKNVRLREVANSFEDNGQLTKDHKLIFNEQKRVEQERELYFKNNHALSEWELIALQSAFFKAGQDAHTHFSKRVASPEDSKNLQDWLLDARTITAKELGNLELKKPVKNLEMNSDALSKLKKFDAHYINSLIMQHTKHEHANADIKMADVDAIKHQKNSNKELTALIADLKRLCTSIKDDTKRKEIKRALFAELLGKLADMKVKEADRLSVAFGIIDDKLKNLDQKPGILKSKTSTVNLLSDMKKKIDDYYKKYPNMRITQTNV